LVPAGAVLIQDVWQSCGELLGERRACFAKMMQMQNASFFQGPETLTSLSKRQMPNAKRLLSLK
jgi:hypothetical protein